MDIISVYADYSVIQLYSIEIFLLTLYHMNLYGGFNTRHYNTLYRLFCFFKLFLMVGKGITMIYRGVQFQNGVNNNDYI